MLLSAAVTVSLTYTYAMDRFNQKISDLNEREALYNKLSEIDDQARNRFAGGIDEATLQDAICAGYAAGLSNSNARYMSAERYADYASSSPGGQRRCGDQYRYGTKMAYGDCRSLCFLFG